MLVLYASETGTAEDVAYQLGDVLGGKSRMARVCSVSSYTVTELPEERGGVVFIVSTTGDGDVPTSMVSFWQFLLRKSLPADSLEGVSVAVFGLGDSGYDKYNAAARRLWRRLKQLGASELIPLGLGDDQAKHGYLTALNPWVERLLAAVGVGGDTLSASLKGEEYQVEAAVVAPLSPPPPPPPPPLLLLLLHTATVFSSSTGLLNRSPPFAPPAHCKLLPGSSPIMARVVSNTRMTAPLWPQDVRHLVLSLLDSPRLAERSTSWPLVEAGDVASVHPRNPGDATERAMALIISSSEQSGWTGETLLHIRKGSLHRLNDAGRQNRIQAPLDCTLRELCELHLDLCGVPRRSFFDGLARFATNAEEQEKLLELASAEGTDLYYDYCVREKRGYLEVLEEFRSARPPLSRLLELVPPMQPRHYSIASCGGEGGELHLCAAVVESVTPYGRRRRGVCSSYLASLLPGDSVPLWVRRGNFSGFVPPCERPVLCVGPGTGVAPMRAILQQRRAEVLKRAGEGETQSSPQPSLLFFGCRKQSADFLFGDEWRALGSSGGQAAAASEDPDAHHDPATNITVTTAFSQDGPPHLGKTYVQAKIKLHGALVWRLLESGGVVLVSGSAKRMPSGVRRALVAVVESHGGLDAGSAERYVQKLEASKRYVVEAWS